MLDQYMPNHNASHTNQPKTPPELAVPKEVKLIYKGVPRVKDKIQESAIDINALIMEATALSPAATTSPYLDENIIKQVLNLQITAEDAFKPAEQVLADFYEKYQLNLNSLLIPELVLAGGDKEPKKINLLSSRVEAVGLTNPGLQKQKELEPNEKPRYPENTDAMILNESKDYLTAMMLTTEGEGPEVSAVTTAAAIHLTNEQKFNNENRFPPIFANLDKNIGSIKQELGQEDKKLEGMAARLNLKTYELEISGNSDKMHCLVIDPSTGTMETYRQAKEEKLKEEVADKASKADWEVLQANIEQKFSGKERAKRLARLKQMKEQGLSDQEKAKILKKVVISEQTTVSIPVVQGQVVVMATDKFVQALKGKEAGIVASITEGKGKGKPIDQICREMMQNVEKKQANYDIEEASRSIIAFEVK